MFDLSFGELLVVGVVALIVIGPERLPKVARTVGHLVGRAQRYVNDVKSDIQREVNLSELNDLKSQMNDAARSVKESMQETGNSLREPFDEARQAIGSIAAPASQTTPPAPQAGAAETTPADTHSTVNTQPEAPGAGTAPAGTSTQPASTAQATNPNNKPEPTP